MKCLIVLCAMVTCCYATGLPKSECDPAAKVCEFWLQVKEALTMMQPGHHGPPNMIKAQKGTLFRFDESYDNITNPVHHDSVITADGVQRMVIAVNGTIPGPSLVVSEGQQLIVHVQNAMISDTLTMHWHGMYQKGTNYMDGVGYITQCPISGGQTFTYKFKAEPAGTHWYHSHVGAQRTNGIYGALIVRKRTEEALKENMVIMTAGEWEHHTSEMAYVKYKQGNFYDGKRAQIPKADDGGNFTPIPWVSGLINGRARYTDHKTGKTTGTPYEWFTVDSGKTYRFRVIHTGAQYPLRISIDGHDLIIVASDGHDIQPTVAESFLLQAGERFDFEVKANKAVGNYWLRAVTGEAHPHSVEAVFSYKGAGKAEPTTKRRTCTKAKKCTVFNCLLGNYKSAANTKCILIGDAKSGETGPSVAAPKWGAGSQEYFFNWNLPFTRMGLMSNVNGKVFAAPMVASASQDNEIDPKKNCATAGCGKGRMCFCNHEVKVPHGKTIQMVWLSHGAGAHGSHPIHLHGYSFYVLKTVFAAQDPATGHRVEETELVHPDIDCGGDEYCNEPKWKDSTWNNGNVPGLNLKNPVRKDTIVAPNGGYVVLRVVADNPGKWFMHCHIEVHAIDGMAATFVSGQDQMPDPPKGFPICNNFYNEPRQDFYRSNQKATPDMCPANFPHTYYNGQYCCKYNKEGVHAPQGNQCDGSDISINSMCCQGQAFTKCPYSQCVSYKSDNCQRK